MWRLQRERIASAIAVLFLICTITAAAQESAPPLPSGEPAPRVETDAAQTPRMEADTTAIMLDSGFRMLYELDFKGARSQFLGYQKLRPEDPLGKAAEAASYLFEQFNQKGVLTSDFFLNDSKFLNGIDGDPAQNHNPAFIEANHIAREQAKQILKTRTNDPHGLLVLTMTDGMEADYDQLIEKKQMASLSLIRQAEAEARTVLAIDPSAQDAYVALGAGNYIIGSLPGFKRAFLWMGGIHGDKQRGMEQMESAVAHGRYLRPFAKILLALACEREHRHDRALALLGELATEFPANPLFAHEFALLQQHPGGKH
jgi:hypothetical protein